MSETASPAYSTALPVGNEHKQAYGTAKTENLRDSGIWRWFGPLVIVAFCFALLAIPAVILIELLTTSVEALRRGLVTEGNLTWLWIVMAVITLGLAIMMIVGLSRALLTQAGNYKKSK